MKNIFVIVLVFISFTLYGQAGSLPVTVVKSKVIDSTTVSVTSGWGGLYYNAEKSSPAFEVVENGLTHALTKVYGDISGSLWSTSVNKIKGAAIPALTNGILRYSSGWTFDNSTYLTTISGITAGGDLSGTFPNPTVAKINGTSLSGLATGLYKNTTGTGVPSIAVSGTDYQAPITLTTTGTSGAATFIGNTLNIPNYSGGSISGLTTGVVPYATSSTTIGNSEIVRSSSTQYRLSTGNNGDVSFYSFNTTTGTSASATIAAVIDNGASYAAIAMYSSSHSTLPNKMVISNTTSDIVILPSSTGKVLVSNGTIISPARNFHSYFTDGTNTSTVGYSNRMTKALSSGTPTTGIGVGVEFETQTTSGGTFKVGTTLESVSTNLTSSTEAFDLVFKNMTGGTLGEQGRLTAKGNFYTNPNNVATGMTDGFIYIPTANGIPSGIPTTITNHSALYIDSSTHKLWAYIAGTWYSVLLN